MPPDDVGTRLPFQMVRDDLNEATGEKGFASQVELNLHESSVGQHQDVDLTGLQEGDFLAYVGGKLVPVNREIASMGGDMNFSFFNGHLGRPYVTFSSASWELFFTFLYRGSTIWEPNLIRIIAEVSSAGSVFDVRIVDITSGLTVATITDISGTTPMSSFETTSLSNLSSTPTVWTFQTQRVAGNGSLNLYAGGVYYSV